MSDTLKILASKIASESYIDPASYHKHNIKRGLRNEDGTGVLVGITKIAEVKGYEFDNGKKVPVEGALFYRGIALSELMKGISLENRFGFEEVIFLLLFNKLPNSLELRDFKDLLFSYQVFPDGYVEDVIIKIPAHNIMNKMQRAFLTLYSYDEKADDISILNVLEQSLKLIAKAPMIMAYSYHAKRHSFDGADLMINRPVLNMSMAENILHMIFGNGKYTLEEVALLDMLLMVQAEHGGGNNSTFATHVVSSTGTDTYSAMATAIGSLKGPKHGGANLKVHDMVHHIKNAIDFTDKAVLEEYLRSILAGEAYDKKGLIYGIGHAVYTKSDARVMLIKQECVDLAKKKGCMQALQLVLDIEEIGGKLIKEKKGLSYQPSGNIDLYSSFVMEMLNIPLELYTPLFAVARMAGWSAHRLEQIMDTKIMRPGYVTLGEYREYIPINRRK